MYSSKEEVMIPVCGEKLLPAACTICRFISLSLRVYICSYIWSVMYNSRCHWGPRAPPWAAAYSAERRARGSGSGCGSSSKTRCSTPSQPVRWGGTESPTPAPKNILKHSHTLAYWHNFYLSLFLLYFEICLIQHKTKNTFNIHTSAVSSTTQLSFPSLWAEH